MHFKPRRTTGLQKPFETSRAVLPSTIGQLGHKGPRSLSQPGTKRFISALHGVEVGEDMDTRQHRYDTLQRMQYRNLGEREKTRHCISIEPAL